MVMSTDGCRGDLNAHTPKVTVIDCDNVLDLLFGWLNRLNEWYHHQLPA